jgi:hypothetical protein
MSSLSMPFKLWFIRDQIDGRLARGAAPAESPELTARAAQLTSERNRRNLAAGLERAVATVDGGRRSFGSKAPVDRAGVEDARLELLDVATLLRGPEPVAMRGVALVEQLLTQGDSPLYARSVPTGTLREAARQARAALLLAA